jgi:UDP-N-acetylglucosamine 2-epimerase (non-hydrolysing)
MSTKPKVMVVIGTRPEAIKMAPVINEIQDCGELELFTLSTGQHGEMLESAFEMLGIRPSSRLQLLRENQSLADLNGRALGLISKELESANPDLVLVHGDTTTAYSATMAAFYRDIPVGHVEAGLRTNDLQAPFPEEFNRRSIGITATYQFAPTKLAVDNLRLEGVESAKIFLTGNTVVDMARWAHENYLSNPQWQLKQRQKLEKLGMPLEPGTAFALVTLHRRENRGEGFEKLLHCVREAASKNPSFHFIFPVHPNPAISDIAKIILGERANVHLVPPVDYLTFLYLLSRANFALSDSGGVQEEGVSFDTRILVARSTTERPEGIDSGHLELLGRDTRNLDHRLNELCKSISRADTDFNVLNNPYGDGRAAKRIVDVLLDVLTPTEVSRFREFSHV